MDMHFSGMDAPPETPASTVKLSRKCLTGIQKKTLLMFLQLRSTDGKLDKGAVAAAVEQWGVKKTQVYTLWNEAKKINIYDREQFESFTKALSPKKKAEMWQAHHTIRSSSDQESAQE